MSTSDELTTLGGGIGDDPIPGTSQHPDCRPTVRVVIGDENPVEVPTVTPSESNPRPAVEVQMAASDGPSDLSISADALIPYEWGGHDVFGRVTKEAEMEGFRSIGHGPMRIDVLDTALDDYVTVAHLGILSIGPGTHAGTWRVMAGSWGNFFESIGFTGDFENTSLQRVLSAVLDTINADPRIPDFEARIRTGDSLRDPTDISYVTEAFDFGLSSLRGLPVDELPFVDSPGPTIEKSFTRQIHSCADALDWVTAATDTKWWPTVEVTEDGLTPILVIDDAPQGPSLEGVWLDEDPSDNGVVMVENGALQQIGPITSLRGLGQKTTNKKEVDGELPSEVTGRMTTTRQRPSVTVDHKILTDIVGDAHNPPTITTNAVDLSTLENQAKRELASRISMASGGQIVAKPTATARPWGEITAPVACYDRLDRNIPPVTYSIHSVIHEFTAPTVKSESWPKTILRLGMETKKSDIVVREKQMIDLKGGE